MFNTKIMELNEEVSVCDQRVQEIVDLIKSGADIVAVETKINEFSNSQQEYKNAYLARVLIHDDLVRDRKAYINVYKKQLLNYIDRSHRVNEVFVNAAEKYLELLEICYKSNDKDQNYADILEYAFYVGDQLATAKHYDKESHRVKLLNLRDKLIKLFVDNEEIAEGIRNAWEYVINKNELLPYSRFYNNEKLLIAFFKFINDYFEKLDQQNKLTEDILVNYVTRTIFEQRETLRNLSLNLTKSISLLAQKISFAESSYLYKQYSKRYNLDGSFLRPNIDQYSRESDFVSIFEYYEDIGIYDTEEIDLIMRKISQ